MPLDDTLTISIDLDQDEVTLVVGILQRAADECRAAAPSDVTADQYTGITLGQLTARWTDIAERELHCAVVNLHGERLFTVPLTAEGWYQVRAALSACVAQLSGELDDSVPADTPVRERMYRALHLAHKIAEATNDR
ncbi:hypothetical protein [Streptomyces alboniger]|uniref:Uncharacterized protein n=1 Tax=Streptomyces alboniger TaxID=132473 RepID=A0A5J6HLJ8_STRAD|nr:hypothetical protein [Streptomyces alboniger]QEV19333.1 hypothetical protein CP975_19155 [Streptomyces alboniger]